MEIISWSGSRNTSTLFRTPLEQQKRVSRMKVKPIKQSVIFYPEQSSCWKSKEKIWRQKLYRLPKTSLKRFDALLKADAELEAPHYPEIQRNLLDNTVGIIHKYQPKLEASSGFWNQLKANLNVLIEKMTGIKDLLSVDKTTYGQDAKLQDKKDAMSDMKNDIDSGNFRLR